MYAIRKKCLLKLDKILPNKNTSAVVVSEKEGINIDNDFHLELARKMLKVNMYVRF